MGYTHYWNGTESKLNSDEWNLAIRDCLQIITNCKDSHELDFDDSSIEEYIFFNGNSEKDEDYETFVIPIHVENIKSFGFCKTANKPYDDVVVACLARLAESGLIVSSDGNREEWERGTEIASRTLQRKVANPIGV